MAPRGVLILSLVALDFSAKQVDDIIDGGVFEDDLRKDDARETLLEFAGVGRTGIALLLGQLTQAARGLVHRLKVEI